jgi:uncharacterized membrane protein YphA (DoxX/SURF4 family)
MNTPVLAEAKPRSTATRFRSISFWLATLLIAAETGTGAVWDLLRIPFVSAIMAHLGYPAYVLTIMGVWKALGVVALLIPGWARLKEWVYAGLVIIYTGAAASHLALGETANAISPLLFTGLTFASWFLRPRLRRDFEPLFPAPTGASQPAAGGFALSARVRRITYWTATVLVAFELGPGGLGAIARPTPLVEGMRHLGYPVYFCVILGVWKVLGAVALLWPRYPRLKEWAYAGAIFNLTGAIASHLAVRDSASQLISPVLFTLFALVSWALRPPARRDLFPGKVDLV